MTSPLLDDSTLDTSSSNSTTTCNREYVLDWHQERLIDSRAQAVECSYQLLPSSSMIDSSH